jgi:thiol:disulfide interchange protein DsbD
MAIKRPTLLIFYADWCMSCQEMEKLTFSDQRVRARLSSFEILLVDMTANKPEHQMLLKHFGLYGPPAILFFNQEGDEISAFRLIGYQPSEVFLKTLENVQRYAKVTSKEKQNIDTSVQFKSRLPSK